jgi:hypothetical protein
VNPAAFAADPDTMVVPRAGEILFRLRQAIAITRDPFVGFLAPRRAALRHSCPVGIPERRPGETRMTS